MLVRVCEANNRPLGRSSPGSFVDTPSTDYTLDFLYDLNNRPYMLYLSKKTGSTTSSAPYYYILNLQGDVVHLVNTSGKAVASYSYDPYGAVISKSGSLADLNPLRYRGYYYDTETGFYYLQSRYYDPALGRFINGDSYASTGQGYLGFNMFAYCNNNPVISTDPSGDVCVNLEFWMECTGGCNVGGGSMMGASMTAVGAVAIAGAAGGGRSILDTVANGAKKLLTTAVDILYSKPAAVPATQSVAIAQEKVETKEKVNYSYWTARRVKNQVIVGAPLTFAEACLRVSCQESIMCKNQPAAFAVVIANGYHNFVGPEKSKGDGYYWHYHPTRNHKGYESIHVWFYGEAIH